MKSGIDPLGLALPWIRVVCLCNTGSWTLRLRGHQGTWTLLVGALIYLCCFGTPLPKAFCGAFGLKETVPYWGKQGQEPRVTNWNWGMLPTDWFPSACPVSFGTQVRHTCLGMPLPTMDWAPLHQWTIKKMFHAQNRKNKNDKKKKTLRNMSTDQFHEGSFSIDPSS